VGSDPNGLTDASTYRNNEDSLEMYECAEAGATLEVVRVRGETYDANDVLALHDGDTGELRRKYFGVFDEQDPPFRAHTLPRALHT
jgi:hypothetical protein